MPVITAGILNDIDNIGWSGVTKKRGVQYIGHWSQKGKMIDIKFTLFVFYNLQDVK